MLYVKKKGKWNERQYGKEGLVTRAELEVE